MIRWVEPKDITLKERFRLLFRPMKAIKEVNGSTVSAIYYKEMDGNVYVIKDEQY